MYIRLVTFQLDGLDEQAYVEQVRPFAPAFREWPGLRSKTWIRARDTDAYGGLYVFESRADADASRTSDLHQGMIANPAFVDLAVREFEVIDELTALTCG